MSRGIRFGMVGGGRDAFIGAVHRMAMGLDGSGVVVAGALSSTRERSLESGRALGLAGDRVYGTWGEMLEGEAGLPAGERIEAVSIVTPNDTHAAIAGAFLEAGIHVVVDKPMVCGVGEAEVLRRAVEGSGVTLTVTYNYSGYPMVREARARIAGGELGALRKVFVEYHQGWLSTRLEGAGQKQAGWRTDPARTGGAGALGDIGTHAEHLAAFVTGRRPASVCADVRAVVAGRRVDDDASVLLRYGDDGLSGVLTCSQVCFGEENGLSIRVYGERGSLAWRQERPNELALRGGDGTLRVLMRGSDGLGGAAVASTRTPAGHPEGFIEAFANVYRGAADRVRGEASVHAALAPGVEDGVHGAVFVERVLASAASGGVWTPL